MSVVASLAAALGIVGGAGTASAAAPTTPPFTECPPVGYSASCSILLDVNADNSVSVLTNPEVGPYDGGDDTLVGIVNNSDAPVSAVTVDGPGTDLSGFDDDGLCQAYYNYGSPLGCPFGTTGYEGPGTSFHTSPRLPDEAEVDFNPELRPGQTAYFSLEGALSYARLTARKGSLNLGPAAQILFLHGVTESYTDTSLFKPIRDALKNQFGAQYVTSYDYYQDAGACNGDDPGQQTPPVPDPFVGMPYESSQNDYHCDSEGDLGQNATRLDAEIQRLVAQNGVPVILVGYSMGGETIRSFLSYSTHEGDGVATSMVDSVVLLHGVEQGSWIADGGPLVTSIPFVGTKIGDVIGQAFPNPNRPAVKEFADTSSYMHWVDSNSDQLPNIPTYNTFGDERITVGHCLVPYVNWGCISTDYQKWGDIVLNPGTDNPTQTPDGGGARFLPGGYSTTNWEWAETARFLWDPIADPLKIQAYVDLYNAPEQHMNYPHQEDQITVKDCKTGADIKETQELLNVITARMNGSTYSCEPPAAPAPYPGPLPSPSPGPPPIPPSTSAN